MHIAELHSALAAARTRSEWVEQVTRYFSSHDLHYGHGTASAGDEAFWLVWQLSGAPADVDALPVDSSLPGTIARLAQCRVEARKPLAYLLGSAYFAGLEFEVGPAVLVPRSPLAELVEGGFEPWCTLSRGDRVLEIGTGSGCIAVAAAVHNEAVSVVATDVDPKALAIAARNVTRHGVGDRVELVEADLFPDGSSQYRVIIANPPYVPTRDVLALPAEYRHEPAFALDGGEDGLDVVRRILEGAASRLLPGGLLIVEVGLSAEALIDAYPRVPWTWIEFERGGDGVFLLTAEELQNGW